jgi:hypothetical protein
VSSVSLSVTNTIVSLSRAKLNLDHLPEHSEHSCHHDAYIKHSDEYSLSEHGEDHTSHAYSAIKDCTLDEFRVSCLERAKMGLHCLLELYTTSGSVSYTTPAPRYRERVYCLYRDISRRKIRYTLYEEERAILSSYVSRQKYNLTREHRVETPVICRCSLGPYRREQSFPSSTRYIRFGELGQLYILVHA